MVDMHVRPARVADRERLVDLWERCVRTTHGFLEDSDVVALRPLVAEELASDAFDWWVLVSGGAPIGFLGFANNTIEGLFIDPGRHREGGGTLLVAHAQSLSSDGLAVDVNEQNEAALRFYEKLGFSVVGRSPTDAGGRAFPICHLQRAAMDHSRAK